MSTAVSIREALLGENARKAVLELVDMTHTPLGVKFWVKGLSTTQRSAFEATINRKNGKMDRDNLYARLAVRCICDEGGQRVFSDQDALQLGEMRADLMAPIYDACQRLSGYSDEDIEDLGKDSATTPAPPASSTS